MGILIVDDNQSNLFVIENILKRAGYNEYLSLTSAKELFAFFQRKSPTQMQVDTILMDIMMPEMDGIEACKRLQQIPHLKDIPVIFVTALEDSNKVAQALDAGGIDYVMKPINKIELLARIRVALRLKYEKDWHFEQDEKIRNELDLSMQVQTSLLSEPIDNENILITASYLPAFKLAGDMYYWQRIDEHRYAAIQLDMMGHGISASLVCMFISSVLRDAITKDPDPEFVIKELNRWMSSLNYRNQQIPYYFTAIYLVLDTKNKRIEYVNAGHPTGFAFIDHHKVVELKSNACAIGFFDEMNSKKAVITYSEKIQMLLCTDGVEEAIEKYEPNGFKFLIEKASTYWGECKKKRPIDYLLSKKQQANAEDDMCVVFIQSY
ncbi:sigma-B regulation protein RsbU (phosphoserine phosphatase) [Cytobacillus eiseniae]|uniref:Sigma-B regulation protein RsbU (Phosphoserine phosphatase) n=1 Tax=Cytobacillus eiseniae TaxID=762947 RepID=A0ABS4RE45_9BACI|nr:fused response regulator/phosphatase [Cytobacillus eiseniae]MBP2241013.1 sigma-B regulation protein RsbU (phosphoserine phosphatase) [Cytobacillus eiseniae]